MYFKRNYINNTPQLFTFLLLFILSTSVSFLCPQTNWNTELLGRWAEGTCDAIEVDDNYIYVGNGSYIDIYENFEEPNFIVRLETPGIIRDILRVGDYLYVANEEYGLRIFNVSDINNPVEVGFLLLPSYTQKLFFRNNIIYSANSYGGLKIIDVADPTNPIEISSYLSSNGGVHDLAIKNDFIFITDGIAFTVLDIADLHNPIFIKRVYTGGLCNGLAIQNNNLFTSTQWGISIFAIDDPTNPELKYRTGEVYGKVLKINSNYAFIANDYKIDIVDISIPDTLFLLNRITTYGLAASIRFKENVIYVADSFNGLLIIDITDLNNPIYKYHIPSGSGADYLTVDNNYVYISNMGLRIIDVSDPFNPQRVGTFQTIYGTDKIYKRGKLIFLADSNIDGLRIIDVEYPNYPLELSQIKSPNYINSIGVYQNYLYLAQWDNINIWDITGPHYPVHINTLPLSDLCWEFIIKDSLLITSIGSGELRIYSLSDPEIPDLISVYQSVEEVQYLASKGNSIIGGTHAGFEIIDITNPGTPNQVSFFPTPYMYDLAAVNNYLYIAFAETGIKIYDLNNISSPQEVGYYDTKGIAWSVDCWDDKIFVADSRYGMPIIRNVLLTSVYESKLVPFKFELLQNYPNPFNPTTTISWQLQEGSRTTLKVFDILGRELTTLIDEYRLAGKYEIEFNSTGLPSGVYFYRIQAGDFVETKKMILLK